MGQTDLVSHLGLNLGISTVLILFTSFVHYVGLSFFTILLRFDEIRQKRKERTRFTSRYLIILFVVVGLFGLHTVEIWTYAAVFQLGFKAFDDFETSLYFSIQNFVALGYGDVYLPRDWRLVGAIEAVNGVVLLGWSTAFFITVVTRLRVLEHEWVDALRPKHDMDLEKNDIKQ